MKFTSYQEVQFVNLAQISKHLECSICSTFFCHPHRLSCGHTYCQACLTGLKTSVQNNQPFKCPECRLDIDMRYISEDQIAKNLMEEQMNCCLWQGQLRDLQNHLKSCNFKERHDEMSQNFIRKFDKDIKEQTMNSDLNTVISNQTYIDEKLQENINKNVGEGLLVRLFNKNRTMGQQIAKSLSTNENSDSKSSLFTAKRSNIEKQNTLVSCESEDIDEYQEFTHKEKGINEIKDGDDEFNELFQMFSDDQKSDTKEILNSQPDQSDVQSQQTSKQPILKGKRKSKSKKDQEDDEEYVPQQEQKGKRGNKKRANVGDPLPDVELQSALLLYEQYGIDISELL